MKKIFIGSFILLSLIETTSGQLMKSNSIHTNSAAVSKPAEQPVKRPAEVITHGQSLQKAKKPSPSNLLSASVSIATGDDGTKNTYVYIDLLNTYQPIAAEYYNTQSPIMYLGTNYDFVAGQSVTKSLNVKRYPGFEPSFNDNSVVAGYHDFNKGGELQVRIQPKDKDTWKIDSISVTFSFEDDPTSPHTLTWSNLTLSESNPTKDLRFDSNFKVIQ